MQSRRAGHSAAYMLTYFQVEDALSCALEQRVNEAQVEHVTWLGSAQDKVGWCSDLSGDRYAIEAKLATVSELLSATPAGEQKVTAVVNKWDLLRVAMPAERRPELDEKKSKASSDWRDFVDKLMETKTRLETCMHQWQGYDEVYETFSQWVKDTENKLRALSALQPNLAAKTAQLSEVKVSAVGRTPVLLTQCPTRWQ